MTPQEILREIKELDEVEDGIAWWRVQWLIARVEQLENFLKSCDQFYTQEECINCVNTGPEPVEK